MRKLFFVAALSVLFIACKKDSGSDPDPNPDPGPGPGPDPIEQPVGVFQVNFYKSDITNVQDDVPLLTIKNDEVQITTIGSNSYGMRDIRKIYIADKKTEMEWVVLLSDFYEPEFIYAVNTETQEKLPHLYWIETIDSKSTLRYYEYDWANRLGTLQYEAELGGNQPDILYGTRARSNDANPPVISNNSVLGGAKVTRSFPAPVMAFNKFMSKKRPVNTVAHNSVLDAELDAVFDEEVNELMDLLKETKTKLIQAPCDVSRVLNKADKNFICKLADQLNKVTDEKIFGDLTEASDESEAGDDFDYQGENNYKFDVDFFDDMEIDLSLPDNLSRHLNDFREYTSGRLSDWFDDLRQFNQIYTGDLDDLSDSEGVIQVGLSWNTETDIDLHVTDPYGEEIYYAHSSSESGGYLDRDDTDGIGPENIYWIDDIPDGTYRVSVVYYGPEDGPLTDYTIKVINGLGVAEAFTGSIGYFEGNSVAVTSFTKTGRNIEFHN